MKLSRIFGHFILAAFVGCVVLPTASAQEAGKLDQYLDKYWGEKREVKVIQKRLFQKDGRHAFTLFGGVIPNDEFLMYYPLGLRWNYYISEDIGIELFGTYVFDTRTELKQFLQDEFNIESFNPQVLKWTAGLEGVWSPVHGKLGIFTSKLFHFDWQFAVGVGAIGTNVGTREEGGQEKSKIDVGANVGTGLGIYMLDWLALRIDYRHFFYAAEGGGVSYPAELTLGAQFFVN